MLSFRMRSSLGCCQPEKDCYRYLQLYVCFMVTTKQNPIVDTQNIKGN